MATEKTTRQKIIQTVSGIILSHEQDLSMSQIAKEVGISKSSLYYFFPNKKALLTEVIFSIFDSCEKDLQKLLSVSNERSDKKILNLMEGLSHIISKESAMMNFVFRQFLDQKEDSELFDFLLKKRKEKHRIFVDLLDEGVANKIFKKQDTHKTAEIILALIDFYAIKSAFPIFSQKMEVSNSQLNTHLLSLL